MKAQLVFPQIKQLNIHCEAIENLKEFANKEDTISCATLSTEPLIWGGMVTKRLYLDMVADYRPDICEMDDQCLLR
ncbi:MULTISPECIES: hypothetical protein [unclassified Colwellia]|uniref:hypothetical protein n=1 Tax=unclassified Colwellia TaxID=196834 RepID=UPI0015F49814|nr:MULTISPECIES: hypothetical protein [unclassified Colwellia]MBA6230636.1 hypothetical protein [Colwellia sp. MB02u-7]MBA6234567.1 hypothetical protein [Colwellia sp. MB02u-11]MBA6255431.1 hypothetical protein [Colwellia sp. MB3u-28]MBA6261571.1 hypothetical protein [Colwellia sp. MB3u-41]MBA6301121.1 hypothetical protein [Colwellia sp. MB3u-22]